MLRVLILCLFAALPARAEEVVAGLSQARVSITTTFHGSEILVFGAVKRETTIPDDPLDVIITVSSPLAPVTVRKKDRRMGIWVNTEMAEVELAPTFYAVQSTSPLEDILDPAEDIIHLISVDRAVRAVDGQVLDDSQAEFLDALIRIRSSSGGYVYTPGAIELSEDTLFRASVALPANLTEGNYVTRIFLVRNKEVVDSYATTIDVQKVGLERWIYNLAHELPLAYGLLSLFLAALFGWSASAFFRLLKN